MPQVEWKEIEDLRHEILFQRIFVKKVLDKLDKFNERLNDWIDRQE